MDKISVIIPTYNRIEILKETLSAYNNQNLSSDLFQVIVIDDGSTDNTFDYLKNNKNFFDYELKIFRQKNSGPNSAREKGIFNADYPLLLITGDDMIPDKNFLEEHLKHHAKYPDENCSVLGFIDWHPDIKLDSFKKYITSEGGEQFSFEDIKDEEEVTYHFFYTSNISFKKSFINELDYIFDKDFTYPAYDDLELGVRLWERGLRILYNKNAIVYHKHNITIDSFANRSYNSGRMGWIYYNKQPAEKLVKKLIINCLNNYKTHLDKGFQESLLETSNEINKIEPEKFDKIKISETDENVKDKLLEYQKVIFQNLIVNRFANGFFDEINENFPFSRKLNIAVIPEKISEKTAPSCIRAMFPSVFLNVLKNVNIFYPKDISDENLKTIDVVIVQRSAIFMGNILNFIKIMKEKGKRIILDIDDLLWELDDKVYSNFKINKKIIENYVDILTVATDKLKFEAEKFFNIPTKVIPNYVDINYFYYLLFTGKKRKRLYIGVIGTPSHKEDFDFIAHVIKKLINKYKGKVVFKFWGYMPEQLKNETGIYFIPFEIDYIKYSERLRKERFDFCLVPLLENKFNNVKSNIKWLEFSINKIPAIFSDVSAYESIKNLETGIKVENNLKDWEDAITLMIEDNKLRNKIKENAYKEVLNNWTLQKNFWKILEIM